MSMARYWGKGWLILFFLGIAVFNASPQAYARKGVFGGEDFVSGPFLLSPVTENIDLSGKDSLDFQWERRNYIRISHYEFRLYKGYDMSASTRILKQKILPGVTAPFKMDAGQFEVNQVYAWSLRIVFTSGMKSDYSFSSFKITKK